MVSGKGEVSKGRKRKGGKACDKAGAVPALQSKDWGVKASEAKLITSMLEVYMRGSDTGDAAPRAARLVERMYQLAMSAENEGVRLSAMKEILDRIDGKVVERKEIKNLKLEGILYLPQAAEISEGAADV